MIVVTLLFIAQDMSNKAQTPKTAVEWVDHYSQCLNENAETLVSQDSRLDRQEVGRRATVRCWPVRASARKAIISELSDTDDRGDRLPTQEIANRLLNSASKAFALDIGLPLVKLGPLDPP